MSETHAIDWPAVQRRLEHGAHLLETAFTPPPQQVERILTERAQALARRQDRTTAAEAAAAQTARRSVLLLEVGSHIASIEIHWVREVLNLPRGHAPVPDAHALLLGVVNVHSQIVNLVSPWPLLHESAPPDSGASFPQAVLLRHAHLSVAIGCTAVLSLVELPPEAWQDERLFLHGTGSDQRPAVLIDVATLIAAWEKDALGQGQEQ